MNILLLGPRRESFDEYLRSLGDDIAYCESPLTAESVQLDGTEWLVSWGYRHILRPPVLAKFPERAINLHISYLPWNRGADPNLWSFLENTPRGVTIHLIDAGIDTGDILAQDKVKAPPDATLRTSYDQLVNAMSNLFVKVWPEIRLGVRQGQPQPAGGSLHRIRDRAQFDHLLTNGWDTPVAELIGRASGAPMTAYELEGEQRDN